MTLGHLMVVVLDKFSYISCINNRVVGKFRQRGYRKTLLTKEYEADIEKPYE